MYFNYFNKFNYNFGSVGGSYEVCDIFSRPVILTAQADTLRVSDDETPDQLAETLYDDNELFYANLLLNNVRNKNDWPKNEVEFTRYIDNEYFGFSFHILELPEVQIRRGDLLVLAADIPETAGSAGECTDPNDLDCFGTYGLVEEWDSNLRKLWVKKYSIGGAGVQSDSDFFKQDNKFKLFRRNQFGTFDNDPIQISNEPAFASDPNYTFAAGEFTMKRVEKYQKSTDKFVFTNGSIGGNDTNINPYNLNISNSNSNTARISGTTYNSALGNTGCSVLDAYILSAGGQTGPDTYPGPYQLSNRVSTTSEKSSLDSANEELRYIRALKKSVVGNVAEELKRKFNG